MKIRDRLIVKRRGKIYLLEAASDGKMQSVRSAEKGWQSYFPPKEEPYEDPIDFKPFFGRRLYRACDLFLQARWPGFKQVFPNGITKHPHLIKKEMIQRFLKIAAIGDVKEGKTGTYRVLEFEPNYMLSNGTPVASALGGKSRTVFGPSTINGKPVKADGLFDTIEKGTVGVGTLVEGQVARVQTTPYTIEEGGRPITQWTGIVFGHENIHDLVNTNFARQGKRASTMNGDMIVAPDNLSTPVTAVAVGEFKPLNQEVEQV